MVAPCRECNSAGVVMGVIVRIWALVLLVLGLEVAVFISGFRIGHDGHLFVTINFVAFVVLLVLLLCALVDCQRRNVGQFAALTYGDRKYPPEVMKRIWTWGLLLSFVLGLAMPLKAGANYMEGEGLLKDLSSGLSEHAITSYEIPPVVLSSKGFGIKGYQFYREVYLRIPLVFIIGLYLYFRFVVRRVHESTGL